MDFIRWDGDLMATGIASIDEQHKELIKHLNELHQATLSGVSLDDIRKILNFLGRYAAMHFQHEEGLMDERACPIRLQNRRAHSEFLRIFRGLVAKFSEECDPDEVAVEIKRMSAMWLSAHICKIDVALRQPPPEPVAESKPAA
jgi:hemerythrin